MARFSGKLGSEGSLPCIVTTPNTSQMPCMFLPPQHLGLPARVAWHAPVGSLDHLQLLNQGPVCHK